LNHNNNLILISTGINSIKSHICNIIIPFKNKKKLNLILIELLKRKVIFDLNNVNYYWFFKEKTKSKNKITIVFISTNEFKKIKNIFKKKNLLPKFITINSFSLFNLHNLNKFQNFKIKNLISNNSLLVDIGHLLTNFTIIKNKNFFYGKTIIYGGHNATKIISNNKDISYKKSEHLKHFQYKFSCNKEMFPSNFCSINNLLKKDFNFLIIEIRKIIIFLLNKEIKINNIIISGGGSKLKGFHKYITKNLNTKILLFKDIFLNKNQYCKKIKKNTIQQMATILSYGITPLLKRKEKNFNFIKNSNFLQRRILYFKNKQKQLIKTISIFLLFLCFYKFIEFFYQNNQLKKTQFMSYEYCKKSTNKNILSKKCLSFIKKEIKINNNYKFLNQNASYYYYNISKLIQNKIYIHSFYFIKNNINITIKITKTNKNKITKKTIRNLKNLKNLKKIKILKKTKKININIEIKN
jgi:Tfp pilus assembly PilM family ATPase